MHVHRAKERRDGRVQRRVQRNLPNTQHYPSCRLSRVRTARTLRQGDLHVRAAYIMIKPDGVQRGLVGKIIQRFEERGYQVRCKQMLPCKRLLTRCLAGGYEDGARRPGPARAGMSKRNEAVDSLTLLALQGPQGQALLPRHDQVHGVWPRGRHGLAGQGRGEAGTCIANQLGLVC